MLHPSTQQHHMQILYFMLKLKELVLPKATLSKWTQCLMSESQFDTLTNCGHWKFCPSEDEKSSSSSSSSLNLKVFGLCIYCVSFVFVSLNFSLIIFCVYYSCGSSIHSLIFDSDIASNCSNAIFCIFLKFNFFCIYCTVEPY